MLSRTGLLIRPRLCAIASSSQLFPINIQLETMLILFMYILLQRFIRAERASSSRSFVHFNKDKHAPVIQQQPHPSPPPIWVVILLVSEEYFCTPRTPLVSSPPSRIVGSNSPSNADLGTDQEPMIATVRIQKDHRPYFSSAAEHLNFDLPWP